MPSPVKVKHHANPHLALVGWVASYIAATPGVEGGDNATLRLEMVRSKAFPGLWLQPAALWANDLAALLAVLQQGLASPEHAGFVARLTAN